MESFKNFNKNNYYVIGALVLILSQVLVASAAPQDPSLQHLAPEINIAGTNDTEVDKDIPPTKIEAPGVITVLSDHDNKKDEHPYKAGETTGKSATTKKAANAKEVTKATNAKPIDRAQPPPVSPGKPPSSASSTLKAPATSGIGLVSLVTSSLVLCLANRRKIF